MTSQPRRQAAPDELDASASGPWRTTERAGAESSYELMKEKVAGRAEDNFRPGVPQPHRRDGRLPLADGRGDRRDRRPACSARVRDQLRAQQMSLEVTEAAKDHIIKLGYDVAYGARPLRRVIQNMVEDAAGGARSCSAGTSRARRSSWTADPKPASTIQRRRAAKTPVEARDPRRPRRPSVARPRAASSASPAARLPALGRPVPRLRRVEQPGRDASSASRRARSASAARVPGAASAPTASADIGERTGPRLPVGHRRARSRPGRRARPGSLVLLGGEPGIGKSTLLLQAAAGVAGRRAAARVLYAIGRGVGRPGPAARGAARPARRAGRRAASEVLAETRRRADRRARPRATAGAASSSIRSRPRPSTSSTGRPGASARSASRPLRLMDLAKGDGDRRRAGRPRDQGRLDRRARRRSSTSSTRCLTSKASGYAALRLLRATKNRFGSTDEVGVFEMAEAGSSRSPIRPARSSPTTARAAPGSVVAPTLEGSRPLLVEVQALVAPAGYGTPPRRRSGVDPNRLAPAGRGPRPAGRHRAGQPRRLREPGRRAGGGGAGPRPAARARPRVVAARPADRARGPWRSARSGCSASCARSPASSAGSARPPGSASAGRSSRARAGRASARRSTGLEVVAVATLREAVEAGAGRPSGRSWRGGPGDARLTARPGRARPRGRRASRRGSR